MSEWDSQISVFSVGSFGPSLTAAAIWEHGVHLWPKTALCPNDEVGLRVHCHVLSCIPLARINADYIGANCPSKSCLSSCSHLEIGMLAVLQPMTLVITSCAQGWSLIYQRQLVQSFISQWKWEEQGSKEAKQVDYQRGTSLDFAPRSGTVFFVVFFSFDRTAVLLRQ